MVSNSSKISRFCIIVTILFTHLISTATANVYKEKEILEDLPEKENLAHLVIKLEKAVNFAYTHKRFMDLNFGFGLFLVNVNLRTIMQMKGDDINNTIWNHLRQVLWLFNKIMKYFQSMVYDKRRTNDKSAAHAIADLFTKGDKVFSLHLQAYTTDLIHKTKFHYKKKLISIYSKWPKYEEKLHDFDHLVPAPPVSDKCISSLWQFPINPTNKWKRCKVSDTCMSIIHNGTDCGYGITHRLLFLLMARFSRGCTIMSPAKDKQKIDEFCAQIYNELEYHSYHGFRLPDISLEMISLCTLEGHAQFLRQSWLEELLEYQKDNGCFASSVAGNRTEVKEETYKTEKKNWELTVKGQDVLGGSCNTHTTGVGAAVLAATIRYIMEKLI